MKKNSYLKIAMFVVPIMVLIGGGIFMLQQNIFANRSLENQRKQIILISIDTLRADHLPFYGYTRNTAPHMSELVERATLYKNTYANSPWTYPSHMTLLTGTLPSRHGVDKSFQTYVIDEAYPILNDSILNIAQILQDQGVHTIKYAFLPDEIGFNRGFDKNFLFDPLIKEVRFQKVLTEIEDNKNNDFFLFLHTWKVHAPYSGKTFLRQEKKDEIGDAIDFEVGNKNYGEFVKFIQEKGLLNIKDCIDLYDGDIYYVDQYIKRLIDKCKQAGIYDDMLFVIVSDHGEHFGERNKELFYDIHGIAYYEEFVRIPFIVKYPYQTKQKVNYFATSLVDFLPTVLDFYKIDIPDYVQGTSLLNGPGRDFVISEATSLHGIEMKMIFRDKLKYVVTMKDPSGPGRVNWDSILKKELYDVRIDPLEYHNLATLKQFKGACLDFEKLLVHNIAESAKFGGSKQQTTLNKDTIQQLKSLGYID
ncbi:MAG: sulfatase [Desulfobacteraceae bacterium]|nr:sulfatase [Desulfobacteraceae bacterium]MBC2755336.1 sulfatase [Desulfobacteraceae bacterium]